MPAGLSLSNGRIDLADKDRSFSLLVDTLTLDPGEIVALTGQSGSGKTLLLELLGLLRPTEPGTGYCWQDGQVAHNLDALWAGGARNAELARMRGALFGFVPQTGGLLPFLNVAENIALSQKVTNRADPAWCGALQERLDLEQVAAMYPGDISIGQRQRTAIARALAHRPPFIIADEPTAALDPETADAALALLLEIAADGGVGVILSSHDIDRVARFGIARMSLKVETVDQGHVVSRLEGAPC